LFNWVHDAEVEKAKRAGMTPAERERTKKLERENFELRRSNEILKAAALFFQAELDRRQPR
jgi:transposase